MATARHYVRLVAARATGAKRPTICAAALDLLGALDAAIHPLAEHWKPRLTLLNAAIDEALDDAEQADEP